MKYIIVIFFIFCLEFFVEFLLFKQFNQSSLDIQTFDGSNQPYHPSVLYFENKWNGFHYWMVETPYPIGGKPYRDRWECPSIHVSNDGIHWKSISDKSYPIDNLTEDEIRDKNFFSDPHLVSVNNHIECFYRLSQRENNHFHNLLLRKTSSDGKKWSEREMLIDMDSPKATCSVGDMIRSQAIIYSNKIYNMWYVDNVNTKGKKHICYSTSTDGKEWREKIECTLNGFDINPWHIDVIFTNGIYYLTIYDFNNITLWEGQNPTNFHFVKVLLEPSFLRGCFYSDGLYRASLVKDMSGFKLYFSAYTDKKTSIGLMQGNSPSTLKIKSINGYNTSFHHFVIPYLHNWRVRFWYLKRLIK